LPGASRTPPLSANLKGFEVVHLTALRSETSLSIVVVCNYYIWSGNGGSTPSENSTFTTHVDPVSPPDIHNTSATDDCEKLVEAPGTAPGSVTLIPRSVYRHSRASPALLIWR